MSSIEATEQLFCECIGVTGNIAGYPCLRCDRLVVYDDRWLESQVDGEAARTPTPFLGHRRRTEAPRKESKIITRHYDFSLWEVPTVERGIVPVWARTEADAAGALEALRFNGKHSPLTLEGNVTDVRRWPQEKRLPALAIHWVAKGNNRFTVENYSPTRRHDEWDRTHRQRTTKKRRR